MPEQPTDNAANNPIASLAQRRSGSGATRGRRQNRFFPKSERKNRLHNGGLLYPNVR